MKLLICLKCSDVHSLVVGKVRHCQCGLVRAKYVDKRNAEWNGEGMLLGFDNHRLVLAIADQIRAGDLPSKAGRKFEAFIIPTSSTSVVRNTKL